MARIVRTVIPVTNTLRSTLLVAATPLAIAAAACAHTTASSATASYTAAQAEAGDQAYQAACTECHTQALSGSGDAPPLAGASFARRWNGRPFAELTRFMRDHMPRTLPGVLNDRTYLAVTAYVLARNGVPAGRAPLTPESTGTISIGSR
jgi:mono/diheme cytochrome c family protein